MEINTYPKSKRSTCEGGIPIPPEGIVISDLLECPVCAERSYIYVYTVENIFDIYFECLSCAYDGSMEEWFRWLGGL